MSLDRESDASDAPQRRAFLGGEGDAWEARNRTSEGLDSFLIARLAQHLEPGDRVLEVGCGSGQNLRALDLHVPGLICHGIDPSTEAIAIGSEAAPHQRLAVGASDELPFNNAQFRLVLFGFCLYLCDRSLLQRTVAEADRVLEDGRSGRAGVLAIVDFDPDRPHRRAYHHREGIWSYMMDCSGLFPANPTDRLSDKIPFSHAERPPTWTGDPNERVSMWILRKDSHNGFPERE